MNLVLPSPLSLSRAVSHALSHAFAGLQRRRPPVARPAQRRDLAQDTVWALPQPQGGRIECLSGALWLTQDWQPHDIFLTAGQSCTVHLPYRLLVQATEPARLQWHAA